MMSIADSQASGESAKAENERNREHYDFIDQAW
jgi:hypothetical protein